jgi:excisionase family DNA binding protein
MFDLVKALGINDPLVPASKAAELLGLSRQTLATWRHRGDKRLPWIKLGKRAVRYKLSDVQQFVSENRHAE